MLSQQELKEFLDEKADFYNRPEFITNDPIQIPHRFTKKEDIEISGFITATIAWGKREMIIRNAEKIILAMDKQPHEYVINYDKNKDFKYIKDIKHRTFNADDLDFFIRTLQNLYRNDKNLENVFLKGITSESTHVKEAIIQFRKAFFSINSDPKLRTFKHVSNPQKGSASKRINMFLRWMVRQDNKGVDFGIWNKISPAILSCPLDVHSGNIARKLGLLHRKQNDWKALEELDKNLRKLDANDPVKYDFALFGIGVNKDF